MPVNLLFVDDEPKLQAVIEQLFRKEIRSGEYQITFVTSGADALAALQNNPAIEIVLTDLNMPKMNGLALLEKLTDNKADFNPVLTPIVVSAYGDIENIRRAMNAGAFDFLTKPLDFADMRQTVIKANVHVQRLKQAIEQEERATTALRQINQELERRVHERTTELQKTIAELNAFAHTVAHDLKNPLGIIAGYIDYLSDFFSDIDVDEMHETLENIRQHTYKSINIVEELLLMAGVRKFEAPKMTIDTANLVKSVQHRLRSMIQEYQAEIIVPTQWPQAIGYPLWVEEVWMNYMTNGLKYGGTPPRLELGSERTATGMICFWLRDNGAGLSAEEQQRLFTEFTRLNEARGAGHGLGLSIVRRIVEKLGGEVGVDSEPGYGSKFYFTLPAVTPTETKL